MAKTMTNALNLLNWFFKYHTEYLNSVKYFFPTILSEGPYLREAENESDKIQDKLDSWAQ